MKNNNSEEKTSLMIFSNNIIYNIIRILNYAFLIDKFYVLWIGDQRRIAWIFLGIAWTIILLDLINLNFLVKEKPIGKENITNEAENKKLIDFKKKKNRAKFAFVFFILFSVLMAGALFIHRDYLKSKTIILIMDINSSTGEDYRISDMLYSNINDGLKEYPEIVVKRVAENISESDGSTKARIIGESRSADLVIWGWYVVTDTDAFVNLYIENLNEKENDFLEKKKHIEIQETKNELDTFRIQKKIGSEIESLSLFLLAYSQYNQSDYFEAKKNITSVLSRLENERSIVGLEDVLYFYRANCNLSLSRFNEAIIDYDKAIEKNGLLFGAYYNRALCNYLLENFSEASFDFEMFLFFFPNDAIANEMSGSVYYRLGLYEKSIAKFSSAISIQPDFVRAYNNRGVSYGALGKNDLAILDYEKVIEINPLYEKAYYNCGVEYLTEKEFGKAIEYFKIALSINPEDSNAYHNLGSAYLQLGFYKKAYGYLVKALDNTNNLQDFYKTQVLIKIALLSEMSKNSKPVPYLSINNN